MFEQNKTIRSHPTAEPAFDINLSAFNPLPNSTSENMVHARKTN